MWLIGEIRPFFLNFMYRCKDVDLLVFDRNMYMYLLHKIVLIKEYFFICLIMLALLVKFAFSEHLHVPVNIPPLFTTAFVNTTHSVGQGNRGVPNNKRIKQIRNKK